MSKVLWLWLLNSLIWCHKYEHFFLQNEVRKIRVAKRENFTINRLNKTKREVKNPDLRAERENRDKHERDQRKQAFKQLEEEKKAEDKRRKEEQEKRSYSNLMTEEKMVSNRDGGNDSDDFMWFSLCS